MNKTIDNVLIKIKKMCPNDYIINHIKNILKDYNQIIEFNNTSIKLKKYDDILSINTSNNSFDIYATSWSTTYLNKITYLKQEKKEVLAFNKKEVTTDGIIEETFQYIFEINLLTHFTYIKKVNLEYEIRKEIKKIKKDNVIDIYPIDENEAIKVINKDGICKYYYTQINDVKLNNIQPFSSLYSKKDEQVNFKNLTMILK